MQNNCIHESVANMRDLNIKINRLGAVRDAEISLKPFMLFMGESGLGKSYVAFLAHYIYVLLNSDRMNHFFDDMDFSEILSGAKSGEIFWTLSMDQLYSWINADAVEYVRYMIGHDKLDGDVVITWPLHDKEIEFIYEEQIEGLMNDEEMVYTISTQYFVYNKISSQSKIDASVFTLLVQASLIEAVFRSYIRFSPYVLPPSRGALLELNERPAFRSGMYESFFNLKADLYRPLKKQKDQDLELESLLRKVNNGSVSQVEGQVIYTTTDGIPMPITAAASSVKELAPFAMLLMKYPIANTSILFEEPEAHLHPRRQQSVADLIAYAVGQGCHIQITTHSDYFIKRLNLLLKLNTLRNKIPSNLMHNLLTEIGVNPLLILQPEQINAYYLTVREDGSTNISKFDICKENMIPFDSFEKTIMDDFLSYDIIDRIENSTEPQEN